MAPDASRPHILGRPDDLRGGDVSPPDGDREGPGLVASVWRHRLPVVVFMVVAILFAHFASSQQPEVYEASATLYLGDPRRDSLFREPSQNDPIDYIPQQAAFMTSRTVLSDAITSLSDIEIPELRDELSVEGDFERNLMVVTASGPTARHAADRANAVVRAYERTIRDRVQAEAEAAIGHAETQKQALQQQIDEIFAQLAGGQGDSTQAVYRVRLEVLVSRLQELDAAAQSVAVSASSFGSGVDRLELAEPPEEPVGPVPKRDAAIAGILALMLGSAWAYWQAGRPKRVRTRLDPASALGVPLLGEIPLRPAVAESNARTGQADPQAYEAYGLALSSIDFALRGRARPAILITSATPAAGKTTTALYLGYAAARDGRRPLVIDADLRGRALTRSLQLGGMFWGGSRGGSATTETIDKRAVFGDATVHGLSAAGLAHATADAERGETIERLRDTADLTIFDAPSLLASAEPNRLAQHVDGIVVVVRHRTPFADLEKLAYRLSFVAAPTLGYVYVTPRPEGEPEAYASRLAPDDEYSRAGRRPTTPPVARRAAGGEGRLWMGTVPTSQEAQPDTEEVAT